MSARPAGCSARVEGDGCTRCAPCGVSWDRDELEPPLCPRAHVLPPLAGTGPVDVPEPERTVDRDIPVELPAELALRMATAYDAAYPHGGGDSGRVAAIRAAYRVFLDAL